MHCGLVVTNFGSRDSFADEHQRACCRFKVFNFHTTVSVKTWSYVVVKDSIDNWYEGAQEKKFKRQMLNLVTVLAKNVFSSGEFGSLDWFSRTSCLPTGAN